VLNSKSSANHHLNALGKLDTWLKQECLPSKHEALTSSPSNAKKKKRKKLNALGEDSYRKKFFSSETLTLDFCS
jgi:hypothetical protein